MKDIDFYRYNGKRRFNINHFNTSSTGEYNDREVAANEFVDNLIYINKAQQKLYAERKEGIIFVFQAMDAAGKDGVIRTVFSTLSPHGVKEYCFKVPSAEEKSHDFLWRFSRALPPKGFISIFNRSYYEDVLIGKVRELYKNDLVPDRLKDLDVIRERYHHINAYEKYLYATGTRVVKIFLNVSKDEQARRFISRIDTQRKNWKVSAGDMKEREYWDAYMEAFEKMVNSTSTDRAPWYVVPADHKWFARLLVSCIVRKTLEEIDPHYPPVEEETQKAFDEYRKKLVDSMENPENIEVEKQMTEFSNTGLISADILQQDELNKVKVEEKKVKEQGFNAITELLGRKYIIHSTDDIMKAIADGAEEDKERSSEEEEDIIDFSPKAVRRRLKQIAKEDEEDEDKKKKKGVKK